MPIVMPDVKTVIAFIALLYVLAFCFKIRQGWLEREKGGDEECY